MSIKYNDLIVEYNGKKVLILNKALLDMQNAWDNLEEIKEAHWLKLIMCDLINETKDLNALKELALDLTEIEYHLQELWGFPKDSMYHRFWEYPKCLCPKLDNSDDYPYLRYISGACLLHGQDLKKT